MIPHLRDGVDAGGDHIRRRRDEGRKDEARTVAKHHVGAVGEEESLKVFSFPGLGSNTNADNAVDTLGGSNEDIDDGGFANCRMRQRGQRMWSMSNENAC